MNDTDFYEVLLMAMSDLDTQFQFWLSITSAFVAAVYIGGDRLGAVLRYCLTLLYLASCVLIFLRMLVNAEIVGDLLAIRSIDVFTNGLTEWSGLFRLVVMCCGTLGATVYAVFHGKLHHAKPTDAVADRSS